MLKEWVEMERIRERFETRVDTDYQRLYNTDIDVAIRYMQEVRDEYRAKGIDINLEEFRDDYEEFEVAFVYYREESDEEYAKRMRLLDERLKREAEEAKRDAERKRIAAQIETLKRQMNDI